MKKVKDFLFSTRLMAILFLVYAGAMAVATFIENDFGTPTAQVMVFDAWWFEAIMIFFVINFVGNIYKFNLLRPKKWITLMFHLSFILIIIGAGITRYISYEGLVIIKEGDTATQLLSRDSYLQFHVDNDEVQWEEDKKLKFSKVLPNLYNDFSIKKSFQPEGEPVAKNIKVEYVNYITNVVSEFKEEETGEKHLHFVESTGGERTDHYIKDGEVKAINRTTVGFNTHSFQGINIIETDSGFILETNEAGSYFRMRDQFQGEVFADSVQKLNLLSLYTLQGLQFVVPELAVNGVYESKSGDGQLDELIVDVTVEEETKRVYLKGGQYALEAPTFFSLSDLNFRMSYGSKLMDLPFGIKLNDFILDKYPGSESPKSFESEVTVVDGEKSFDFKIFMNNILDYKGFRLFQSSYNITPEFEETRLSVNHDYWGTMITYIGYFMLYAGLMLILVVPGSRFTDLGKMLDKVKEKKKVLFTVVFLFMASFSFAQHTEFKINVDSLLENAVANVEHAEDFSRLVIQEEGGRMVPFNTFSSQLIRKVSKKDTYRGYTADQVSLSMITAPRLWYAMPIIYLEKGNIEIRDLLGVPHEEKYARLIDFFDLKGVYKIKEVVSDAHKEQIKSKFQKDVINIDKRSNLLYAALEGDLFRFFPLPNDENDKWYSAIEVPNAGFKGMDSTVAASILTLYSMELEKSIQTKDYEAPDKIIQGIQKFQNQYGSEIMPTQKQIDFEILYNKFDIFKKLFVYYLFAGMVLFILAILQIFTKNKILNILVKLSIAVIVGLFLAQTAGLAIRWFISGHAPWSNAYESMIYIAWATLFFGLGLGRKSVLTIASATFVTSMMLMIAHWNWMDPTIGTLVPVLNSYWLMIHVAIIVASYGPFAVGMITGFISLLLMIFTTDKNKRLMKLNIEELTIITEMALTLGVVLLSIGNFLGGMWANESWGRYWGWDPKETWALISIMVYAFIIHSRLVPGLRGKWTFNVMATFAFTSVLMTYLGVNHLLSGLHSYAAGEKAAIPNQIWYSLAVVTIVSIISYFRYKKHYDN